MRCLLLTILIGASSALGQTEVPTPQKLTAISLREARIELAAEPPPCVRRSVDDLCAILQTCTGRRPEIVTGQEFSIREVRGPTLIRIRMLEPHCATAIPPELDPRIAPPDSFQLSSTYAVYSDRQPNRTDIIEMQASRAEALRFAIAELISRLKLQPGDVRLDIPLNVHGKPLFNTRGMYAHLHWSYNRPYALRSWTLGDWKRYVDLLTYLGFNTIQIWPMMELLPHPLSAEDRAYLERYAAIVDYAHQQRGMKVFVGSCANNITEDARGVPISNREYFDFEKLLDPGQPENLQRILEYRSDLYRTVPDADGYWVIDSDPGGFKGSPSADFVNILKGHRELIDRYGKRPAEQPLIYWMWFGWGAGKPEQNWPETLSLMNRELKQPWLVHVCLPDHLKMYREHLRPEQVIAFPYGVVETEPCAPLTELRFAKINEVLQTAKEHGFPAILGNAQTPLVQLPNMAVLARGAWGENPDVALDRLARGLLARDYDVLKLGWLLLTSEDLPACRETAAKLRSLAAVRDARGPLAVIIDDWQPRVLEDLASMLELHALAVDFAKAVDRELPEPQCVQNLADYLRAAGQWQRRTGYHNVRIVAHEAYRGRPAHALSLLKQRLGENELRQRVVEPAVRTSSPEPADEAGRAIVDSLLGKRE